MCDWKVVHILYLFLILLIKQNRDLIHCVWAHADPETLWWSADDKHHPWQALRCGTLFRDDSRPRVCDRGTRGAGRRAKICGHVEQLSGENAVQYSNDIRLGRFKIYIWSILQGMKESSIMYSSRVIIFLYYTMAVWLPKQHFTASCVRFREVVRIILK